MPQTMTKGTFTVKDEYAAVPSNSEYNDNQESIEAQIEMASLAVPESPLENTGPDERELLEEEPGDDDDEAEPLTDAPAETSPAEGESEEVFRQEYDQSRRCSLLGGLWNRHKMSLSRAPSTPCIATVLIPLLSLATHIIFLYGQSATMWRLHLSQQVDVWANATSIESRTTMDTLGLPHHNHIFVSKEKDVREFTYMYAIHELWKAAHMPGKVLPRTAAVLLVIFSGVWPHLKLLLLNFTWLFSTNGVRRTRMLHWLSTLGKWSLADVLVVCVMVGVLHLDWVVDPVATKHGLVHDLPYVLKLLQSLYTASDICTYAMKLDCHTHHKSWDKWSKCKGCVAFVKTALEHPSKARDTFKGVFDGIDVSGGGLVYLRVHGMSGIYVFCSAVILSILISLVVDVFDVRAHRWQTAHNQSLEDDLALELEYEDDDDYDGDTYEDFYTRFQYRQRLHSAGEVAYDGFIRQTEELEQSRWRKYAVWAGCGISSILVICGVFSMSIERKVHGAIPHALEAVLGIEWNQKYSLLSLVKVTGAAGGYDYLLMGTFGLFMVLGPLLRVFLCIVASICPCSETSWFRKTLLACLEFVGAFCAWEVLVAAVGMVDLLMPSITSTVIINPDCAKVSADGSCLSVEFDLLDSFTFVLIGGLALVLLANWGFGSRRSRMEETEAISPSQYSALGGSMTPPSSRLLTA